MKALELADALVGHLPKYKTPSQERGLINGAIEELRRLAAVEAERDALKADETPEKQIKRTLRDLYQEVLAERDALKAENERLLAANRDCIAHYEDARAELERIKALEPVAWLSTDCIGERYLAFGHPLDNDPVEPLYALGSKTA